MSDDSTMIIDATTRILQELCDPQTVNGASDESWKEPLWQALEEAGLTAALVPESCGGAGIGAADAFEIVRVAGQFAVPVPLVETMLAGWLLGCAEIEFPLGRGTLAPVRERDEILLDSNGRLSGKAKSVPFASETDFIAVLAKRGGDNVVALVHTASCAIQAATSIAGDPCGHLVFDGVVPVAVGDLAADLSQQKVLAVGALARSMGIAGALQKVLEISVQYSLDRTAFERPISRFQAVQHNLARLAGEAAAAVCAATSAADALHRVGGVDEAVMFEIAAAKVRAGEAAGEGSLIAHQVHGAIGFTAEHVLHRFTQRVWAWRDEFGTESEWALQIGQMVQAKGADELWPLLASR